MSSHLLNDNENFVFHDTLSGLNANFCHLTWFFSFQVVGHLHCLKHNDSVTGSHLIAYVHLHFNNGAREWSLDRIIGVGSTAA